MRQPQKTLAHVKALQYWAEKAQLLPPGEPHQIAESMLELQRAMESLTMFTNAEVLEDTPPSHWVRITSSWMSEPADPPTSSEWRCSRSQRVHARGMSMVTHSMRHLKPTATTWITNPNSEGRIKEGGAQ